ncbi:DNA sulfur modification protein DndD [Scytonema hofmannii PCC 7110]|uniref:Nuclease SbcCD subunit C n=1 Tax=Scytonema hofmannii PCC 7110 TaxID=128403 RepID=A0A139X3F0_9CYAN|nr:DNA sulfur modification protein DndD [Scytonema hofmannii]KYC39183.1 DNA sulfur modification protein DndD [Scytonema hofmannii PCC 7110]
MIFLELVLQNFGPYYGRQIIKLDPRNNDSSSPIILFGGMNGGGKTTLMDAIRLALYGPRAQCSTRGNLSYSDFLTQCVSSSTPPIEKTRIELAFEHIENDKPVRYRIVRTWEKNPKDGKDHLGILDIGANDEWLDIGLVSIWDEYVENLIPLGISNLFLFDGEQVKELAQQEIPPQNVVEAIRGLLGLELAERLAEDLEILVNRKRKELADTKDLANLEEIEQRLQQQTEEKQATQEQLEHIKSKLESAEEKQTIALDKFISEGGKIAGERSQLEKQQAQVTAEIEQVRQAMCQLAADVLPLVLIQPLLVQVQKTGESEIRSSQTQIARSVLLERNERLINKIAQLRLSSEKFDKIKFLIQEESELLASNNDEEAWLLADAELLAQLSNIMSYSLEAAKSSAQQQLGVLGTKEEEIVTLERQLQTAASPEIYQKLHDVHTEAQNKVAEIKVEYEAKRRCLIELDAAIEKSKKNLKKYTDQNIDRKSKEHIIAASAKVQQTLKLFRERLTLKKLNKLEVEVTECFRYLLHKSDLVHRIVIDTDTFGLSLYDLQGKMVPKHRLSAGEKQLLAIAFLWGLARVSGHHLPVAIDTPLGRLDSSHRTNLVERYFPSASHQVILLSTDTEIAEKEFKALQENDAIARKYLLQYDSSTRQTTVKEGYFW